MLRFLQTLFQGYAQTTPGLSASGSEPRKPRRARRRRRAILGAI